jgi:hypothetical protein
VGRCFLNQFRDFISKEPIIVPPFVSDFSPDPSVENIDMPIVSPTQFSQLAVLALAKRRRPKRRHRL